MNYSDTKSLVYQIAEALYRNGPMPSDEIASVLPGRNKNSVKSIVGRMFFDGDLKNEEGKTQLQPHALRYFEKKFGVKAAAAAPRTFSTTRTLSSKHIPSLNPLIVGKLRDISFKTSGTSFMPTV